jgi:electron transport complex protein RnfC
MGGVHPPEFKLTAGLAVEQMPVPARVSIPVAQNLGAPSSVVVAKGEKVRVGQLLAKGEAFISANVHSSVSGTVARIDEVVDSTGYRRNAVVIDVEGDEWMETIDRSPEIDRTIRPDRQQIIECIREMGIVGLGGATFPSHVKLMVPQGRKADLLIINGVECEPFLTSDHRLMLEKGEEILIGTRILMKGLGVEKAIIGIENNKMDAIAHLREIAKSYPDISISALKVKYPQGGEKQLIKALTGREVPSGKLPIDVGCVVNNVGTAFAVYEAVQKSKPLFERVVTVTGKALPKPSNFLVRIGTPVGDLVEKAGGLPNGSAKVLNGGPMMGKALTTLDVPVVKGSSGILVITEEEAARVPVQNCIRCGKCVSVCPMGLEPYLLALATERAKFDLTESGRVMDCIECGSCHYICPSGRPLLDYIRVGKITVGKIIRTRKK